ncbi:MAG: phosphoribosylanthranilate isomerase, partial [Succinivibrio sp.]|nr:phosphoribosylanthranilate isomerase [Succinivibrio sp.]
TMVNTARKVGLSYLQLHGTESIDTIRAIRAKLPEIKIIKAFNISTVEDFIKVKDYEEHCDLMILDSSNPGSGKSFDWGTIPADLNKQKILLSGGIGLDNVEKALSYGFAGLDMNSKLEKEKGIKDVELIDRIFKIVNNY